MKYLFLFLIIINFLYSNEIEEINLEKRVRNVEYKIKNIEREMIFLNENLKRIDKNFEKIIVIINSNEKEFPKNRIKPVKIKLPIKKITTNNYIYTILKDGNIYYDNQGKLILNRIYKGEIIDIENCLCNNNENCFCKVKNKKAYIKLKLIKK